MARSNPPFMSGVPELLLLQQLQKDEMYGYELVKAVRAATGDAITLGEGVIYPVLHSLEKSGALSSRRRKVDGRTRVYYALTRKGAERLDALHGEWQRVQNGVKLALAGSRGG